MPKSLIISTILTLSFLFILLVIKDNTDIDTTHFKFKWDEDIFAFYLFGLTVAVTDYPRTGAREFLGKYISIEL